MTVREFRCGTCGLVIEKDIKEPTGHGLLDYMIEHTQDIDVELECGGVGRPPHASRASQDLGLAS